MNTVCVHLTQSRLGPWTFQPLPGPLTPYLVSNVRGIALAFTRAPTLDLSLEARVDGSQLVDS